MDINLLDVLCAYAKCRGLDPDDQDLYDKLDTMADEVMADIDELAALRQETP
jgi:hypothetical protein